MVIVSGIIGTAAAIWLYNNFIGWLNFLNATLPPIGAIIILDYFLNRAKYREEDQEKVSINWGAVLGVVTGALVGNFVKWGIASVNAMAVACVCYLIYNKLINKNK